MADRHQGTVHVIAAAYAELYAAVDDYETIKDLYRGAPTSHDFDAAVIAKDDSGKVRIVRKHEQPTRHGAAVGLGWGLAVGIASALFPPVGIGVAAAGGAGAAIGGVAGHLNGGMSRKDLKELGEALDAGQAGLIVVYETSLADDVASILTAATRIISTATDLAAVTATASLARTDAGMDADTQTPPLLPRPPHPPETIHWMTAT